MPAFTLNTTWPRAADGFCCRNYMVPSATKTIRATQSFCLPNRSAGVCRKPLLRKRPHGEKALRRPPLSTAARMSATFPVVSSATRVPQQYARAASHFLDGGYFEMEDASALNLYSVMNQRVTGSPQRLRSRLKVLLVEIRDRDDLDPNFEPDDLQHQSGGGNPPARLVTLDNCSGRWRGYGTPAT